MGKEKPFMPFLILFFIGVIVFGFVLVANNLKSATGLIGKEKDVYCNDLTITEAIGLVNQSECTGAGQIQYDRYKCNDDVNRLDFPIEDIENMDVCYSICYVYTGSKSVELYSTCVDVVE